MPTVRDHGTVGGCPVAKHGYNIANSIYHCRFEITGRGIHVEAHFTHKPLLLETTRTAFEGNFSVVFRLTRPHATDSDTQADWPTYHRSSVLVVGTFSLRRLSVMSVPFVLLILYLSIMVQETVSYAMCEK